MPVIPNRLHFIWVGKPLPAKYADNIMFWIVSNPKYDVTLWTQEVFLERNMTELFEAYQRKHGLGRILSTNLQYTDEGLTVTISEHATKLLTFNVHRIETMTPLTDPAILFEELASWANYGAASDILRMWVLHQSGGIYMDTDTYSPGGSIPCNINAPLGILIHTQELDGKPSASSALLASEKGSQQIKEMAEKYQQNYASDFTFGPTGVTGTTRLHHTRFEAVEISRQVMGDMRRSEKDRAFAQRIFRDAFTTPTINRVCATLDIPEDGLAVVSFELHSGFHPIIKSEGSWRPEDNRGTLTVFSLT